MKWFEQLFLRNSESNFEYLIIDAIKIYDMIKYLIYSFELALISKLNSATRPFLIHSNTEQEI